MSRTKFGQENLLAPGPPAHKRPTLRSVCSQMSASEEANRHTMDADQLREATVSGVRWFALARVPTEALQLASAVALARLVSPADFGDAAVALILIPLSVILTYEGFGSALVQ